MNEILAKILLLAIRYFNNLLFFFFLNMRRSYEVERKYALIALILRNNIYEYLSTA